MPYVVSVDLAFRNYKDIGIAVLRRERLAMHAAFVKTSSLGLSGPPDPDKLSTALVDLCSDLPASIILLDGSQAWQDSDNGLEDHRVCESDLNTPAKTGVPGHVKPATYTRFISFCIEVFDSLRSQGVSLLTSPRTRPDSGWLLALEAFRLAAWRNLGLRPLPAKGRATGEDISDGLARLSRLHPMAVDGSPTHDELQAFVAGLAGINLQEGRHDEIRVSWVAPRMIDGAMREGYIVTPNRKSTGEAMRP